MGSISCPISRSRSSKRCKGSFSWPRCCSTSSHCASSACRPGASDVPHRTLADEESPQTEPEGRGQQAERHAANDIERGRVPTTCFEERECLERERAEGGVAAEKSSHQQQSEHG